MKNIYQKPDIYVTSFKIKESISDTQDTEDLSVLDWPEDEGLWGW